MSSLMFPLRGRSGDMHRLLRWLPVIVGLVAMYTPVYVRAFQTLWSGSTESHGPVVLAASAWVLWSNRAILLEAERGNPVLGAVVFALGLLVYTAGVALSVMIFQMGSIVLVTAGLVIGLAGWQAARRLWALFLFLAFAVPLPGFILESMTSSLKEGISRAVEQLLYTAGYPIARNGVTLSIGGYQLLVADACSGERSLYSLTVLGVLYLYLVKHTSALRGWLLMATVLPITFAANSLRVMALVLITYHLGDAAGQGFLHEFAGMVLFTVALGLFFLMDLVLGKFLPDSRPAGSNARA